MMTARDDLRTVKDKGDPVAQWAELQVLYPEAGHWFYEGWHYGALRRDDPAARDCSLEALIDRLLERELAGPAA